MNEREQLATWNPIETAPRDGTKIIGIWFSPHAMADEIVFGHDVGVIKYEKNEWLSRNYSGYFPVRPMAWIPFPLIQSFQQEHAAILDHASSK